MLASYLKIVFRHIVKNKAFSIINISGLSIGMACCALIFLFVKDELSYDKFQSKYDRIYRIIYHTTNGYDLAQIPPPINQHLVSQNPEVETSSRVYMRNISVRVDSESATPKIIEETNIVFADSMLTKIFDFDFIYGTPDEILKKPFTVALTDESAKKYFGTVDVIGKTIYLRGNHAFEVVAVVKEYPLQSHIHFNMLLPYDNMFDLEPESLQETMRNNLSQNWVISHSANYVLLKEGTDSENVDGRFDDMINSFAPEQLRIGQKFTLQPLSEIHLYSADYSLNPEQQGDINYVITFSAVALVTLLIACFNFINLSTAQSVNRTQEVGVRKVLGAGRVRLFIQFMGESAVITLVAFLIGLFIVIYSIPFLNSLTGKSLTIATLFSPSVFLGLFLIYLITTFLGGSFPAIVISRIGLSTILKGKITTSEKRISLRKVLISFQMATSIILISGALIIFQQIYYMTNRPLGFKTESMVTIPLFSRNLNAVFGGVDGPMRSRLNSFEDKLMTYPGVEAVTLANNVPGMGVVSRNFSYDGQDDDAIEFIASFSVDYDFINTFDLNIVAGRDFNLEAGSDHLNSFIVNEKAVEMYDWGTPQDAIGIPVSLEGKNGTIIGVVADFDYMGFQQEMRPLMMDIGVPLFNSCVVRVNGGDPEEIVSAIETEWNNFFPEKSFEYSWLDDNIDNRYQNERRLSRIIGIFAILAILVSSMGAYGLMIFMTGQREKEIGIRKVLGSTPVQIVIMMFKEFTVLFAIGAVIAVPIIYKLGGDWLNEFVYHIPLSAEIFLGGMLITIFIVWATISFQSIKAATKNPVKCLRDE